MRILFFSILSALLCNISALAQSDAVILDRLWKQTLNRAQGVVDNEWYNEPILTSFDIHNDDIFASTISSDTNLAISQGVAQFVDAYLTRDRQYADGKVWVVLDTWSDSYSSGSDLGASITKNFISTKFGQNYRARIFKPTGEEIFPEDPTVPLFDYRAGVLIFQSNMLQIASGSATNTSLRLQAFKYNGQFGGVGSPGANLTPIPGEWNSGTPYESNSIVYYQGSSWYTLQNTTGAPPSLTSAVWNIFVAQGDIGPTGPTGATPVIAIGTVETVATNQPATVSNSVAGLTNVFSFQLPRGDAGPIGPTGPVFTVLANPTVTVVTNQEEAAVSNELSENGLTNTITFTIPTGPQGPQGETGPAGLELNYSGPWNETNEYVTSNLVTYVGSTWYALQPSTNEIPTNNPTYWELFVQRGEDGQTATIEIGDVFTVTNENATVTNIGTASAAIFEFQIPIGPQGPTGETGAAGAQLRWIGEWNETNEYVTSNLVTFAGSTWYAIESNTNQIPTNEASIYWELFVSKGDAGPIGATGETPIIIIGDVFTVETNVSASVSNQVDGLNNTFSFQIPKGDKGEPGAKGDTGDYIRVVAQTNVTVTTDGTASVENSIDGLTNTLIFTLPRGPQGEAGPAGAQLRWIGEWDADTNYVQSNLVTFAGSTWYSLQDDNSNNVPTNSAAYWELFVSKGDIGPIGPTGETFVVISTNTVTLDPGSSASVSNDIEGTTNALTFFIPRGDQGPPGAPLSYIGDYSTNINYSSSNLVTFVGSTWFSTHDNNSNNIPDVESTNWSIFVSQGDVGPQGPTGPVFSAVAKATLTVTNQPAAVSNQIVGLTNELTFYIPIGPQGIPGFGLNYLGQWSATTNYAISNLVTFAGSAWYSLQNDNSNNVPTNSVGQWEIFVERGAVGATGATGANFIVQAGAVTTLEAGASATVSNQIAGTTNTLLFGIPQGIQGEPGLGLVYWGEWSATTNYSISNLVTYTGSAWYSTHDGNSNNTPNISSTNWLLFVSQGDVGPTGLSPTIAIGTVITVETNVSASVSNQVDGLVNTFSFQLPKGDKGDKGDTGATGDYIRVVAQTNAIVSTNGIASVENSIDGLTNTLVFTIPQGPQGIQGVPGVELRYLGEWNETNEYVVSNLVTYLGSAYYALDSNTNQIPTNSPSYWELFVSKGDTGATGEVGATGATPIIVAGTVTTIATGETASVSNQVDGLNNTFSFWIPKGDKGDTGETGTAATIAIGDVLTVTNQPATVENTGTASAAVFKFEIPVGPQGPTGETGAAGANLSLAGTWTNDVEYAPSSIVFYASSSWYTLTTSSNEIPGVDVNWQLFASGASGAITGDYVQAINTLTGAVTIVAGSNITIETNDTTLTISASGGGGSGEVPVWSSVYTNVNYSAVAYDFVFADTLNADVLITLPDTATSSGKVVAVRKQASENLLLVTAPEGSLVQGVQTVGLQRIYNTLTLLSDGGTNWVIE